MQRLGPLYRIAVMVTAAALVAGCGLVVKMRDHARETEAQLAQATTAVEIADTADIRRYAASELAVARDKLAAARAAAAAEEYDDADRLIAEALVNLRVAAARAETERQRRQSDSRDSAPPPRPQRKPAENRQP